MRKPQFENMVSSLCEMSAYIKAQSSNDVWFDVCFCKCRADGSVLVDFVIFFPAKWKLGVDFVLWNRLNVNSHLFQDALIEELLQFLVTVVDAELLEAVVLKVLCKEKKQRQTAS